MSHLTTHVLDGALGAPAVGVEVTLRHTDGPEIARGRTDSDGRSALGPDPVGDW